MSLRQEMAMQRFSEAIKQALSHPVAAKLLEAGPLLPEDIEQPECGRCRDSGFTRRDVPAGHEDFGKLFECLCEKGQARVRRRQERIWAESMIPPRMRNYTLDQLKERPGKAYLAAVMREWQDSGRWLVLWGPKGTCKTSAAVSVLLPWMEAHGPQSGLFIRPARFLLRLRETYGQRDRTSEQREEERTVLQSLIDVPFLVLDDIGSERLSEWGQEKLFTVIDERSDAHMAVGPRITVVTTNLAPGKLAAHLDDSGRTWDRIRGWALVEHVPGSSQRGLDL